VLSGIDMFDLRAVVSAVLEGVRRVSEFIFSRRGQHTSFSRDWSADVCSSDLTAITAYELLFDRLRVAKDGGAGQRLLVVGGAGEIGRASCRERGQGSGVTG